MFHETGRSEPVQSLRWELFQTQAGRSVSRNDAEIRAGQMAWKELIGSLPTHIYLIKYEISKADFKCFNASAQF